MILHFCKSLFACVFLALTIPSVASAQEELNVSRGVNLNSVYDSTAIDSVDMVSGNVNLNIPLVAYKQRGPQLTFDFVVRYTAPAWGMDIANLNYDALGGDNCHQGPYYVGQWSYYSPGDKTLMDGYTIPMGISVVPSQYLLFGQKTANLSRTYNNLTNGEGEASSYCSQAQAVVSNTIQWVGTSDGSKHNYAATSAASPSRFSLPLTVDGSAIKVLSTGYPGEPATSAVDRNGVTHSYNITQTSSSYTKKDSFGNLITFSNQQWEDTTGRIFPAADQQHPGLLTGDLSHCPANTTKAYDLAAPSLSSSGGTDHYYFCYRPFSYQTNFNAQQYSTYPNQLLIQEVNGNETLLSAIVLPNNTSYQFEYDSYLSLSKISLPTGGSYSYTYKNMKLYDNGGIVGSPLPAVMRVINSRSVDAGDGSGAKVSTYAWKDNGGTWQSSVTDPKGNAVVHDILPAFASDSKQQYYEGVTLDATGFASGGTLLKTVTEDYQTVGSSLWVTTAGEKYPNAVVRVSSESELYPTGIQSKRTYTYTPNTGSVTYYDLGSTQSFSNVIHSTYGSAPSYTCACYIYASPYETSQYDFADASSSSPSLLRKDTIIYQWQKANGGAYQDANLVDLVGDKYVYSGAGVEARTSYLYDGETEATSDVSTQKASPSYLVHGALTATCQYSNAGSSTQCSTGASNDYTVTRRVPFDTGTLEEIKDPNGGVTHATWTNCSGSLLGTTTDALGHSTTYGANCSGGNFSSITDPNSASTGLTYDKLGRLHRIDMPDGGATIYDYIDGSLPTITVSELQDATHTQQKKSSFDGLGRLTMTQDLADPDGVVTQTRGYDAAGLLQAVSNPYRGSSSGTTTTSYDGLGRVKSILLPDGNMRTTTYSGNQATITDEAGKSRVITYNAAGAILNVVEDPNSKNLITSYLYDARNNLTSVTQHGAAGESSRVRSFTYDSLSRLVASYNPETGSGQTCSGASGNSWSLCYSYDPNGNLLAKTDARGVTTSYSYDALNRLTDKTFSAPTNTPGTHWMYDVAAGWGGGQANIVGRLSRFYTDRDMRHPLTSTGGGCNAAASTISNFHPDYGNPTYCQYSDQTFSYDAMGRVTKEHYALPSEAGYTDHIVESGYDLAGNPTTLTYPNGYQVTNEYDGAGRLKRVYAGVPGQGGDDYYSVNSFWPNGSPHELTYGGTVTDALEQNSRLQPCRHRITTGTSTWLDREYFYASASNQSGKGCDDTANNNGNIWFLNDNLSANYSQTFQYDGLNRLTSWTAPNFGGAYRQWSFGYDSFGNLTQNNGATPTPASSIYDAKNRIMASVAKCLPQGSNGPVGGVDIYDAAGNLYCSGDSTVMEASQYIWDGGNRLSHFFTQWHNNMYLASTYSYGPDDNRVRVDQIDTSRSTPKYREYTSFNGHTLAEQDESGRWINWIFAGERRIAKVDPRSKTLHLHGTFCTGCTTPSAWFSSPMDGTLVVQPGDTLRFQQWNSPGACGGINVQFTDGVRQTAWLVTDSYGWTHMDSYSGGWHSRSFDLSQFAGNGNAVLNWRPDAETCTQAATWDIYLADVVITHNDGSVTPLSTNIHSPIPSSIPSVDTNYGGISALSIAWEDGPAYSVGQMTRFYAGDHLGTEQMEFSSQGWPVWRGEFAPFGQELNTTSSSSQYKFTGKERDQESGLDYFGARYYASNMGRWMSPDWAAKAEAVPYAKLDDPQTLNLYNYVGNNPLSLIDDDGHETMTYDDGALKRSIYQNAPMSRTEMKTWGAILLGAATGGVATEWQTGITVLRNLIGIGMLASSNPQTVANVADALAPPGTPSFNTVGTAASIERKLSGYLLNTEHATGGPKASWFDQALGFNKSNMDTLASQIKFDPKTAVETGSNEFGTMYNQVINITGANGKKIPVTFAWIKLNKNNAVNLVTAIPTKR